MSENAEMGQHRKACSEPLVCAVQTSTKQWAFTLDQRLLRLDMQAARPRRLLRVATNDSYRCIL